MSFYSYHLHLTQVFINNGVSVKCFSSHVISVFMSCDFSLPESRISELLLNGDTKSVNACSLKFYVKGNEFFIRQII